MLENTHTAKLEIKSLEFEDELTENLQCILSLMKGLQNFGEIRFTVPKNVHKLEFENQQIISFFYAPRLNIRKDVFFKIILTDVENNQQIGDIPISTKMLGEKLGSEKSNLIEEAQSFFPGINLHYKIYQPKFQLRREPKHQIKPVQVNDLISTIFQINKAKPEPKKETKPLQGGSIISAIFQSNKSQPQKQKQKRVIKRPQPLTMATFLSSVKKTSSMKESPEKKKKVEKEEDEDDDEEEVDILDIGPDEACTENYVPSITIHSIEKTQEKQIKKTVQRIEPLTPGTAKNLDFLNRIKRKKEDDLRSVSSIKTKREAEDVLGMTFSFLRDSKHDAQKNKHKLSPIHEAHQELNQLSIKMRMVIFLVLFGLFMIVADFYGDKPEKNLIPELQDHQEEKPPKVKAKSKKKVKKQKKG